VELKHIALGISGSPRKDGNTDISVKMVLEGLKGGGCEAEFLRIADAKIEHCAGCRKCMGSGRCAIRGDDFDSVLEEFERAYLIVLGVPIYWNSPPGAFKDFMDRTHGFYLDRSHFARKKFGILSVATEGGFETHEAILQAWIQAYGGVIVDKVRIYSREKGEVLSRPGEVKKLREFSNGLLRAMQ
jgi:multimeric flavodoxin WrbA